VQWPVVEKKKRRRKEEIQISARWSDGQKSTTKQTPTQTTLTVINKALRNSMKTKSEVRPRNEFSSNKRQYRIKKYM
jgi:hypothetical protein|tara:strand:+ start:170 stop:400 length:231 start_codon:yes stop_codon:yes gene_type:complete